MLVGEIEVEKLPSSMSVIERYQLPGGWIAELQRGFFGGELLIERRDDIIRGPRFELAWSGECPVSPRVLLLENFITSRPVILTNDYRAAWVSPKSTLRTMSVVSSEDWWPIRRHFLGS